MAGAHGSNVKTQEELDKEVAIIAIDHMKQKSKEGKRMTIDALPILAGIDRKKSWHMAMMVPHKGVDRFAIKALGRDIELAGYRRLIIKSDQEPSILELIHPVERERSEDIEEVATEQSPAGEHKSNGQVQRAIQNIH